MQEKEVSNRTAVAGSAVDIDTSILLTLKDKEELSSDDWKLITEEVVVPFIVDLNKEICGRTLYDYQVLSTTSICWGILSGNGWVYTLLQARQSGKSETIACIVMGLGLLIPLLKQFLSDKSFLERFAAGFKVGCFGPTLEKANIIYDRIRSKLSSPAALKILTSGGGTDSSIAKNMKFSNGFSVSLKTAKKGTSIEGDTFSLALVDEAQEVDSLIITKSIMPMLATIKGNMVLVGTPIPTPCLFQDEIERNVGKDVDLKRKAPYTAHHQYDYIYVAAVNPFYLDHVNDVIDRMGQYSSTFQMAYAIQWLDSTGRLLSGEELMIGATYSDRSKVISHYNSALRKYEDLEFQLYSGFHSYSHDDCEVVFGIDYGKAADSTVITIAKVWWEAPVTVGNTERFHVHILDWREMEGDDHEKQFPEILAALRGYNVTLGITDATGVGDPIHSRICAALQDRKTLDDLGIDNPVTMHPFVFGPKSKDHGYKMMYQEMCSGRVTFPYGEYTRNYGKSKKFLKQTGELVKTYRNNYMVIDHPPGKHDDFPDSLMVLIYGVNTWGKKVAKTEENPLQRDSKVSWLAPRVQGKFRGKSIRRRRR